MYMHCTAGQTVENDPDLLCPIVYGLTLSAQPYSAVRQLGARSWDSLDAQQAESFLTRLVLDATASVAALNTALEQGLARAQQLVNSAQDMAADPIVGDERQQIVGFITAIDAAVSGFHQDEPAAVTAASALPRLASACKSPLMTKAVTVELAKFTAALDRRAALLAQLHAQRDELKRCLDACDDPATIAATRQRKRSAAVERVMSPEALSEARVLLREVHDHLARLDALFERGQAARNGEAA